MISSVPKGQTLCGPSSKEQAQYALSLCARIATCSDTPGNLTRLFLSPATHHVHGMLRAEMEALGMAVHVDAAGNLRGFYAGASVDAPVLLTGSHLDTVPNAGAFDGVLGIALPIALLRGLNSRRMSYAIEVIAFSEEEGIRFRLPFIGSRAAVGSLTATDLARTDAAGISIAEACTHFGLAGAGPAALRHNTFAFVECHIEQGPVLEALDVPLGIVTAIVGQTRFSLTFSGKANHAGTTPMHLRQDALASAAAWITTVEQYAQTVPGLVATVGMIAVEPGAANVIVSRCTASLDVRHAVDDERAAAIDSLIVAARAEAARRGCTVDASETSRQQAVAMDANLCDALAHSVEDAGCLKHRMVSGAGHDAMVLAGAVPATMLFIRTPGGLSHHPDEAVFPEDVAAACRALEHLLERLEVAH